MSLGDDILILLPDSALELPEASAKPDAFETPRGPRPDLLLPSPPGINIIEPTPNINFADNDGFVPEAISAEEDPVLRPSFSESSRSPTTESRKSFSELSVASETTRAIERRRSSLSTTMEFRSRRRSSSNNSLPAVISRISRMDEYKLLETLKLGGGATAQVIPAVFKPTNTPCAVKMLFKEGYNARFVDVGGQWKDEIRFLKMIDKHPNVVTVLDAWEDPSYYCTVMWVQRRQLVVVAI